MCVCVCVAFGNCKLSTFLSWSVLLIYFLQDTDSYFCLVTEVSHYIFNQEILLLSFANEASSEFLVTIKNTQFLTIFRLKTVLKLRGIRVGSKTWSFLHQMNGAILGIRCRLCPITVPVVVIPVFTFTSKVIR